MAHYIIFNDKLNSKVKENIHTSLPVPILRNRPATLYITNHRTTSQLTILAAVPSSVSLKPRIESIKVFNSQNLKTHRHNPSFFNTVICLFAPRGAVNFGNRG